MADVGKRFEGELVAALRREEESFPFVMRIKDGAGSEGKTTKNPADIIAAGPVWNFLIEAKAIGPANGRNPTSMTFRRVKPHQRGALSRFSKIPGGKHVGFVALLFYNGKRGKDRLYRCFLVEGRVWSLVSKRAKRGRMGKPRKSMPVQWLLDGTVPCVEIRWVPGVGWDVMGSLRAATRARKSKKTGQMPWEHLKGAENGADVR
jgi:hypothetical protein